MFMACAQRLKPGPNVVVFECMYTANNMCQRLTFFGPIDEMTSLRKMASK